MAPPNPPLSWIASPIKRKTSAHPDPASGVRSVVGRPTKATAGLVAAAMSGIRSIRGECAPPASTTGLQHSASLVPAGRHIRIGIHVDVTGGDRNRLGSTVFRYSFGMTKKRERIRPPPISLSSCSRNLAVNFGFEALLAANIDLDLLRLGFGLLGEVDLQHALVVVGAHLSWINGTGRRERAGEACVPIRTVLARSCEIPVFVGKTWIRLATLRAGPSKLSMNLW